MHLALAYKVSFRGARALRLLPQMFCWHALTYGIENGIGSKKKLLSKSLTFHWPAQIAAAMPGATAAAVGAEGAVPTHAAAAAAVVTAPLMVGSSSEPAVAATAAPKSAPPFVQVCISEIGI